MSNAVVAFDDNFLVNPADPEKARLLGTRCRACRTVTFGRKKNCEHCTSEDVETVALSPQGRVWSYTILHYPSPPPYQPPDPYQPLPAAWVELPEGVRIISTLKDCPRDDLRIGLEVELEVYQGWLDAQGRAVMAYTFKPVKQN
ncbi:MAG: OB-fold domain-containing protein [Thermodesulfobacteriota bacterium]